MTLQALLSLLHAVQARGRRYIAHCPAHADISPSLQVTPGDSGVLLKCWSGCTVMEICSALGIHARDLFYDAGTPRHQRPFVTRPRRIDLKVIAFEFELGAFDRRHRAESVLSQLIGIDLTSISDNVLDRLLAVADRAYRDLDRAALFEDVADGLRVRAQSSGVAA